MKGVGGALVGKRKAAADKLKEEGKLGDKSSDAGEQETAVSRAPAGRVAVFIDGQNFGAATMGGLGLKVDFVKLLKVLTKGSILIRAYFYTGEFSPSTIEQYLKATKPVDAEERRGQLMERSERERMFYKALSRGGFRVVKKPVRVMPGLDGKLKLKADLDIELAIGMLTLADRCDHQILVSGDGDFVPVVHAVGDRGARVTVVSTQNHSVYLKSEYRAADDLVDAADEFIDICDIKDDIEYRNGGYGGVRHDSVQTR